MHLLRERISNLLKVTEIALIMNLKSLALQ